jgi:hypothetical protein
MKRWRHLIVAIGLVPSISVYVMACLYISDRPHGLVANKGYCKIYSEVHTGEFESWVRIDAYNEKVYRDSRADPRISR